MTLSPISAHQAWSSSPLLVGPEGPLAAVLSRVDRLDGVLVRRVSSRLAGDAAAIAVKTEAAPQLALWVVDDRLLAGDDFSALESFVVEVEGRARAFSTSRCFLGVPAHLRLTARLSLRLAESLLAPLLFPVSDPLFLVRSFLAARAFVLHRVVAESAASVDQFLARDVHAGESVRRALRLLPLPREPVLHLLLARLGSLRAIATASESSLRAALGPEDAAAAAAVAAWFRDESLVDP